MTLAEVTEKAEAGNPQAMVSLGHHLYKKGDVEGSIRWLAAAADAGHVPAMVPAAALVASEEHLGGLALGERAEAIDRAMAWVSEAERNGMETDLGGQLAELRDNVADEMREQEEGSEASHDSPVGKEVPTADAPATALTCPHCGKPRSATTRFCRFCGQPIPEDTPASAATPVSVPPTPAPAPAPAVSAPVAPALAQAPAASATTTGLYGMNSLEQRLKEIEYALAEAKFEVLKAEREQDYQRQAELKYQVIPGLERERDVLERGLHQPVVPVMPVAPVAPAPAMGVPWVPQPGMPVARPKNPGTGCIVFDIVGIILVLLCPWVSANLFYTASQMSLLELAAKAMDASSTVSSLSSLSGSSGSSSLSSALAGVGVVGGLMALVTIAMLGVDIAKDHNMAKRKTGYGSMILAITGILVWLIVTGTTSSVSGSGSSDLDAMLSGIAGQMIQCTGWVFISICVGFASYAYHRSVQKKIDIANGVIPAAPRMPANTMRPGY